MKIQLFIEQKHKTPGNFQPDRRRLTVLLQAVSESKRGLPLLESEGVLRHGREDPFHEPPFLLARQGLEVPLQDFEAVQVLCLVVLWVQAHAGGRRDRSRSRSRDRQTVVN